MQEYVSFVEIKKIAIKMGKVEGDCFETSLLGRVPRDGSIPYELQCAARNNGLLIEAGLPRDGKYIVRIVTPNAKSEPTARLFAQVGSTDGLGAAVPPAPTFED